MSQAPPAYPAEGLVERSLDMIFPPLCVGCRRVGRWICEGCWRQITWTHNDPCVSCGRRSSDLVCTGCAGASSALARTLAVATFDGVAREAVHALKFEGHHAISAMMGKLMAQVVDGETVDLVAPVPLHPSRRRERGYDQTVLLARAVARAQGCEYPGDTLKRVRRTQQQTSLPGALRHQNVSGAFQSSATLQGETVLLVDDVMTTGATMTAAAQALTDAGAGEVIGLVFARAV